MSLPQLLFVENLFNAFLVLSSVIYFSPFVPIPVAPMITGMMKFFMFHTR